MITLWDSKNVAVADSWSLFRGELCEDSLQWSLKMVVVEDKCYVVVKDRWSLFGGGR